MRVLYHSLKLHCNSRLTQHHWPTLVSVSYTLRCIADTSNLSAILLSGQQQQQKKATISIKTTPVFSRPIIVGDACRYACSSLIMFAVGEITVTTIAIVIWQFDSWFQWNTFKRERKKHLSPSLVKRCWNYSDEFNKSILLHCVLWLVCVDKGCCVPLRATLLCLHTLDQK